jgi:hypothetical protein
VAARRKQAGKRGSWDGAGEELGRADESIVAVVPAGTLTYSTNEGLGVSGARALFRVYVVLTTLNEKGSNTVGVTRP